MSHQITIELPDDVYETLAEQSRTVGRSLEEFAQAQLTITVESLKAHPFQKWIGAIESGPPDAATRHHEYLGQAIQDELDAAADERSVR
jgi:hypothetical protein